MTNHVVIIDYGCGNLRSAAKAFERVARIQAQKVDRLAPQIFVTADPEKIAQADRVVLPGVGSFAACRAGLAAVDGLEQGLNQAVRVRGVPFLGICVGMHLMADIGYEHGRHAGLGWVAGEIVALAPSQPNLQLKIPHMGWNLVRPHASHPVLSGLSAEDYAYFVHSYIYRPARPELILASTDYDGQISAIVGCDNLLGTQFHPEKSQQIGLRLIAQFLSWSP